MKYLAAVLAALLILAVGASSAAAAAPGVTVIGEENVKLAVFKTAKCKKSKKSPKSFYIDAVSTNGQYQLLVGLLTNFTGFHSYELALDENAADYMRVSAKGDFGGGWSNEYVPPYPVPGFGQVNFTPNGKQVGIGFGPAMWNHDFTSAVVVAGGLECVGGKKKKH